MIWVMYFIVSIVVLLVTLFLLLTIMTHIFTFLYLYIEYGLSNLKDSIEYPTIPLKLFLKKGCLELWYLLGKFVFYPIKFVNLSLNLDAKNSTHSSVAILLIHGYSRNQTDWLWFRKQIVELSYPIFTINLEPDLAAIDQITINSLPKKIATIKQQTSCDKLILIGHSMGGLVASYYSEYLDTDNMVDKLITIASPFYGTKISITAAGANAKQMLPESEFLRLLREKIARTHKKYYQIASKLDNIVFPWQSELLESVPKTQQVIMPLDPHLALLHSKEVVQQVKAWVTES